MKRLSEVDLRQFISGETLFAYEPDSLKNAAKITYHSSGQCTAIFADGTQDTGQYGFSGDTYWTRYTRFRDGQIHHFYLVPTRSQVAQAYYADGSRAFIQSPLASLDEQPD